ncbi:tryptophan ABC transporter substrate-binding protein [Weissella tructae]|uniref:ABC transporter, substrate-binding protein n=2 Tax=Weissella TaxID=46255 RepID=A0A075TXZ5_9LACO|nr:MULTISPECIES: tryptophan ABC transporter substrate-binding protein [Weissella]AIG65211.1 ABC transporter, substrate-binding protein [Weissella tructae]AIM62524.1 ABC transporter, substrate-binding protein [Weissella ceti]AIM63860.1 ABC transporter, substrate-binding protein [Weissella ceti]ELA07611.1 ABC transporter substrate-binding protein [Weissella ceti NC36]QVV91592.1 ABC transporter substrate-binding protein [Weissella tructae]
MNNKIKATITGLAVILLVGLYTETKAEETATRDVAHVGILQFTAHPALDAINKGILSELSDAGYILGKNLEVTQLNAQGDQSNLQTMATKLATQKNDVNVGIATPAAVPLANSITDKPVVFAASTNPVGAKLVKSMEKPGANVTGVSDQAPLPAQLKMIHAFVPELKTLGIIYTSSDDAASTEAKRMDALAQKAGIATKMYTISSSNDLNQTAQQLVSNGQVEAIFVPTDNTIAGAFSTLVKQANEAHVPIFPTVDTMVESGGVAAVSINQTEIGRMTGRQIVKILKGQEPKDMPVDFIKDGQFVVNEKQMKQLNMKIPAAYSDAKAVKSEAN